MAREQATVCETIDIGSLHVDSWKHILPKFGESNELHENDVQGFVLEKLEGGLSVKSVKDILIVLKMVMKFGVKNEWMNYYEWDIKYPTDVAGKKLEVLSVANHKKILNYIQSHFSFPGLGIYTALVPVCV